jgi:protocatechuate 4,5-dioxygenase beta chain
MGSLIGGIGSSHAPSIAFAFDAGHQEQAAWKPFFDSYIPVKAWLREMRADILVIIYNDHLNNFQLDTYPTFAIGLADSFAIADEGKGARPFPAVPGDATFAAYLARRLVADEFDLTFCQEMALDHGVMSILPLVVDPPWPCRVVPIAANVIVEPLPSPLRCWRMGESIGRAIEAYDEDVRVVVMATGGLSHQLHGRSFGFVNPEWDNRFLDLLEAEPHRLARASHDDFIQRGGAESVEMMLWLTMRGALSAQGGTLRRIQRNYHAPLLTGYGLLAYELAQEAVENAA